MTYNLLDQSYLNVYQKFDEAKINNAFDPLFTIVNNWVYRTIYNSQRYVEGENDYDVWNFDTDDAIIYSIVTKIFNDDNLILNTFYLTYVKLRKKYARDMDSNLQKFSKELFNAMINELNEIISPNNHLFDSFLR
jgi:hypothetical protein